MNARMPRSTSVPGYFGETSECVLQAMAQDAAFYAHFAIRAIEATARGRSFEVIFREQGRILLNQRAASWLHAPERANKTA
jgi:hypothetical protein